jgi:polar amino acid transport system substrate-binding protein
MQKKSFKQAIAVLTASVLLAVSAVGCASSSGTSESESTADASASESVKSTDQEVTVIHAATSGNPRPFTYVDDDGNLAGQNIELIQAVFDRLP